MFTLRNVHRPYTQKELDDVYKKDHSIRDEDKQSRLKKCVTAHDLSEDDKEKSDTLPQATLDKDTPKK